MTKLLCFVFVHCIVVAVCHAAIDSASQPLRRTRRQNEVDIITDGRGGVREVDIITGRSGNLDEIDILTDGAGFSDVDVRGERRRGTERRVVERRRPTSRRREDTEIDIITDGRRSGIREIDIIRRGSGDRRTSTTTRRRTEVDDILEERRPTSRRVVDEGIADVEADKFKPMPYKFKYKAPNHKSIVERSEEGDENGVVRGFYRMHLGNGLYRYVDYIADRGGYRAAIRSNEPGIGGGTNIALDLDETPKDLSERDLEAASEADELGTVVEERRRSERRRGPVGRRRN